MDELLTENLLDAMVYVITLGDTSNDESNNNGDL